MVLRLVGSKEKGNRGEREVARLLSLLTGAKWCRVPCSGALFTSEGREGFRGDVYSDDDRFCDFVVEVKNEKGVVSFNDWVRGGGRFGCWVRQLREESRGCFGLLFFKSGGRWCWAYHHGGVMINYGFVKLLKDVSWCRLRYGVIDPKKVKKLVEAEQGGA